MKKQWIFGIISILFLSLFSCEADRLDGRWDDNIKLSKKKINFTAESNFVTITTEGSWWWINRITLNDNMNYDISEIDTTKKDFIIEKSEFTIERINAKEINISMTENQSETERTLTIELEAGNYFDRIEIIQSGK